MTLLLIIKKHKFFVLGIFVLTLLEALAITIPAQIIGLTIDYLSDFLKHTSTGAIQKTFFTSIFSNYIKVYSPSKIIFLLGSTYLIFTIVKVSLGSLRGFLTTIFGEKCIMDLRQNLFSHILLSNISFIKSNKVGDLVSRIVSDANEIRQIIISPMNGLITGIFTMLWAIYFSFKISPQLTTIILLPSPFLIWLGFYFGNKQKQVAAMSRKALGNITVNITNRLNGIITIKAFVKEFLEIERLAFLLKEFFNTNVKGFKLTFWFWPAIGLIEGLVVSIILIYGSKQVLFSTLTVGGLSVLIQYLFKIYDPLINISRFYNSIATAIASLKRVEEITRNTSTIEQNLVKDGEDISITGRIEIVNLSYGYNDKTAVIKNLTLTISPGDKVAIIGKSGSGKSTFFAILTRFYEPTSGNIYIDNKPIFDYRLETLRKNICLIPQEPVIFEVSLIENLRFAKPDASDKEIEDVISRVKLEYLLNRGGLELNVGDMGNQLSLGEKQRISLARVLLLNPSVILFDEPISHLDSENEKNILNLIKELFKDKTIIIASHNLSVISIVDKVLSLPDGKLIDKSIIVDGSLH